MIDSNEANLSLFGGSFALGEALAVGTSFHESLSEKHLMSTTFYEYLPLPFYSSICTMAEYLIIN